MIPQEHLSPTGTFAWQSPISFPVEVPGETHEFAGVFAEYVAQYACEHFVRYRSFWGKGRRVRLERHVQIGLKEILDNALTHTKGEVHLGISVEAKTPGWIFVSVSDTSGSFIDPLRLESMHSSAELARRMDLDNGEFDQHLERRRQQGQRTFGGYGSLLEFEGTDAISALPVLNGKGAEVGTRVTLGFFLSGSKKH